MDLAASRARTAIARGTAVGVIVLLIIIAVGGGYYYYSTTLTPASSGPSVIKIGLTSPLTGTFAEDGTMSLDGLKLWAQNVNASGGIYVSSVGKKLPVQLVYFDDTSSTSVVATDYQTLVTQGVNFLIAPYSSPLTLAAAPIAEANHILLLSHGGASDSIFSKGYKYVVQVLSPGSQYMIPVLKMLQNLNGSTPIKVAFFYGNDAFSISVIQGAEKYVNSTSGFNVVYSQSYDETASSYTAQLSAIAALKPDVLIGGAHFADGETIMKNIQSLGLHFNMVALLVAPDDVHFSSDLGFLASNVVGPSQWESNLNFASFSPYGNMTGTQFASQFQSAFPSVGAPNYEAAEAYATGLTLQKGITDSGSLNSTVVRNQLANENFWTFYGHFQIGSTGIQTGHTLVVMQWQNGAKQIIWPRAVATATFVYPMP
ncbi:MAG: amino acid ABC transporter substrate-binding protein [Nitrososphaerota archaeon]|nr:amino acid ABC transporter substrate-binding protein [Nitrososphaerota archaeon]